MSLMLHLLHKSPQSLVWVCVFYFCMYFVIYLLLP